MTLNKNIVQLYRIRSLEGKLITAKPLKLNFENNNLDLKKDENNYIHMYLEAFSVFILSKRTLDHYKKELEKLEAFEEYIDYIRLQEAKINLYNEVNDRVSIDDSTLENNDNLKIEELDNNILNGITINFNNINDVYKYLYSAFNIIRIKEDVKDISGYFRQYKGLIQEEFEKFHRLIREVRVNE